LSLFGMAHDLTVLNSSSSPAVAGLGRVPALFTDAGPDAVTRLLEFLTAHIRNNNTRIAYGLAIRRFAIWCDSHRLPLSHVAPLHVAAYVELLGQRMAKPSVKQHLAAIRMLFDHLVTGQIVPFNPASSVRGPKYVLKKGKTPVLTQDEARSLIAAIDTGLLIGLRDRALIGVMVYSFARINAVLSMKVGDYYQVGKRWWIRLHEKGGKDHEVPVHHKAEEYLDAYLATAGIAGQGATPLFRSFDAERNLTEHALLPRNALAMVKRRCQQAGLGDRISNHSFRATGITNYLENGGSIEKAQQIAAHESPRTTKLYDRTNDQLSLDEIEKIQI
jgi:integrase/recombinase XerD